MNRITDVVKNLLIINVIVYIAVVYVFDWTDVMAMYYPDNPRFKPFQIVTHMFMHDDKSFMHILFNMMMLYFLGPYVENRIGAKKFLILYFVSGFGALILHLISIYVRINYLGDPSAALTSVVGASGALFGILIAFAVLFPDVKLMLLFPPIPVKAKVLVPILIAIDIFGGFSGGTGIAHFAHIGGAIVGFIMIWYWKKKALI